MYNILIGEEKRLPIPPRNDYDQHIQLAINNDYHYDGDYEEIPYDYHKKLI